MVAGTRCETFGELQRRCFDKARTRMHQRVGARRRGAADGQIKKNRGTCMLISPHPSISESQSAMRHSVGNARDKDSRSALRRFQIAPLVRFSKPAVVGSTPGGKP